MGQKFAAYDGAGIITGFYDSIDSPLPDGTTAIELTDAQWLKALTSRKVITNGKLVDAPAAAALMVDLQTAKLAEINAAAQAAVDALMSGYPEFERLTWSTQQRECEAWYGYEDGSSARTASLVPWCAAAAAARGMDLADFMPLVKANADVFVAASAAISGRRQRLADAIYACTDDDAGRAALAAITWGNATATSAS